MEDTLRKPARTGPRWLKNPRKARPGEVIEGGYFVFRRGKSTKRIKASWFPFEHGSKADAVAQAEKLAIENPGETFVVVAQIAVRAEAAPAGVTA